QTFPAPTILCFLFLFLFKQLDQIIIHQQVDLLEAILGTKTSSKYEIKNQLGQRVYFAVEENDCFDRNLCSPIRSFTIRIADNTGREVITVNRPLRCNSCWFPSPRCMSGYVVQNWDPFLPKFTIQNESKEDVLKIIGPYATCGCFEDVDFEVKALNETSTIGKISKYWSGFVNNVFTNTANFGIQFPVDLDVRIKAVMIGACFLIDLMFFENSLDGL
uniref:Phospholipid scramblase n=1 Tax=Falco tinnunculus TaxID=100819 RepID=A0A8C4V7V6_FALTI